jgi:hypothetical protein
MGGYCYAGTFGDSSDGLQKQLLSAFDLIYQLTGVAQGGRTDSCGQQSR